MVRIFPEALCITIMMIMVMMMMSYPYAAYGKILPLIENDAKTLKNE